MFTEHDLQKLLDYQTNHPVLSVYLNIDPVEGSADVYKLHLRTMLKDIELPQDTNAIERYFDFEYQWTGKSVAVFSCVPENFFQSHTFGVPLRNRARVSNRPFVKPLADLLDSYGGYGVAIVDKQGVRLFNFHLGELRAQGEFMGESVRHTKRGGSSQAAGRRGGTTGQTNYVEEVTSRNIKDAAEYASQFFIDNNIRRVLIGGTDENVSIFRSKLPKTWQSLVVGTTPMRPNVTSTEVLERALDIGRMTEQKQELQLVETVFTNAAKGRGGVIRLEDTLGAVHEGRVQTLIVLEGYHPAGYRCQGCNYLTTQELPECVFCGNQFEHIPDAVELAVRQVLQSGGEVDFLHDNKKMAEIGGIGAILRY